MADSLATLDELKARCDWTFDEDEERAAPGYIDEASDMARVYGRLTWNSDTAPRMAKNIVMSAVRRFMRNPDGYTQSRAGDETLAWDTLGDKAGTIYFTTEEQKLLRALGGANGGLRSAGVTAWGSTRRHTTHESGNVPVSGWPGEKTFPYYADGDGRV